MKLSIIVPTLNEKKNIEKLVHRVNKAISNNFKYEVVIVDDNSQDGTYNKIKQLCPKYPITPILRKKEKGLASAMIEGFKNSTGNILCVMDADLSHPPEKIPEMIKCIKDNDYDIVVASRNILGGRIKNWPLQRKLISKIGILLAKPLTDVKDCVSGFFMIKKSVIDGVKLRPKGYKILLEILVKGKYEKIREIPYTFQDRVHGKSKLKTKIILEYLNQIIRLYFYKFLVSKTEIN